MVYSDGWVQCTCLEQKASDLQLIIQRELNVSSEPRSLTKVTARDERMNLIRFRKSTSS